MKRTRLAAISLAFTLACDGDKTIPGPSTPTTPTPVIASVSIQGAPTVPPGQTVQMVAVARFNDGSNRDVTSDARWTSTQPQIAAADAGRITGLAPGRTNIRATYNSRDAFLPIIVKPDGTFILKGSITEPGSVGVPNAAVAVLGGPPNQATTNSFGFYELFGVAGAVNLRVTKQGYVDEPRTLTVTQDQTLDVRIRPLSGPMPVAGIYEMTVRISPSCSIVPNDQKTRTYTAAVGQDEARLEIQLGDANFVKDRDAWRNHFPGKVVGNTVTFNIGGNNNYYYFYYFLAPIQELLPNGSTLGIWGTMTAPAAPQSISGTLAGGVQVLQGGRVNSCSATDTQVVLTRR